jgi:hypothetical protein
MKQLREAAARERRFPIFWWLFLMVLTGGMFVAAIYDRAPHAAWLIGVLLAAAWSAPILALYSLIPPRRSQNPVPVPGAGTFNEWMKQARLLGRVLIYYEENREAPAELRRTIRAARNDLRDTLRAHPLRDDLERVCQRIRDGAINETKEWFWSEFHYLVWDVAHQYEKAVAAGIGEDERLAALLAAVENSAALMARICMPRMLERERLACAVDCAWLAAQAAAGHGGQVSPIDLAARLVIEWSDFSEPWQPARELRLALGHLEGAASVFAPAPAEAVETAAPGPYGANSTGRKFRRVRVKVRRKRRHRGPSFLDILLSFGQWVRYSIRSFMLYR